MNIRDERKCSTGDSDSVRAENIPVDTVFSGTIGIHTGTFLCAWHHEIVFLDDPEHTWAEGNPTIAGYIPLDAELVIKGEL